MTKYRENYEREVRLFLGCHFQKFQAIVDWYHCPMHGMAEVSWHQGILVGSYLLHGH